MASEYTPQFLAIVADTKRDQKIFERLRSALRICPKGGTKRRNDDGASSTLSSARHKAVLKNLRRSLKRLVRLPRKFESLKDLPHQLAPFIDVAYTELQK